MPVIRVGIGDDCANDRAHLTRFLERYQQDHGLKCLVREYTDGAALLDRYRAGLDRCSADSGRLPSDDGPDRSPRAGNTRQGPLEQPKRACDESHVNDRPPDAGANRSPGDCLLDVVFLDILMDGIDGMRAAEAIRKVDTRVALIFVTRTAKYATKGYSVQAQSYVLKPVSYFAFETEMNRCLARLRQTERASILVGSGNNLRRMAVADIIYVASARHRITVHTADEPIVFSGTLKSFEEQLAGHSFYRSNSGYLINLQHLMAIEGEDAVMSNGDALKISRSRKKGLLEALNNHLGRSL
jgi:DNA-binding LytR/AlgR family response regulator